MCATERIREYLGTTVGDPPRPLEHTSTLPSLRSSRALLSSARTFRLVGRASLPRISPALPRARRTLRASRFIYNYIYAHANHPGNPFSTPANRHSELLRLWEPRRAPFSRCTLPRGGCRLREREKERERRGFRRVPSRGSRGFQRLERRRGVCI